MDQECGGFECRCCWFGCLIPKKLRESPELGWDRNDANGTGVMPNDFDSIFVLLV